MPYLSISDFRTGMDRRRPRTVGVPGSLWELKNAFISRGGDIVRAKKLAAQYALPANTFGLFDLFGQLWVFGSVATPSGLPAGVQYQRLIAPQSPAMAAILDVKAFDGNLYVIAKYADGSIYHFYNGSRAIWDTLITASASMIARRLAQDVDLSAAVSARASGSSIVVTAQTAGTGFTLAGTVNRPAIGTVTVTAGTADPANFIAGVTVNGVSLFSNTITWATSHTAMATAIAAAINANIGTHNYLAESSGPTVTIRAPVGTGATQNGYVLAAFVGGTFAVTLVDMAGGVDAQTMTVTAVQANVAAVAEVRAAGSVEVAGGNAGNQMSSLTVNGVALLGDPVPWSSSNESTALLIANEVNNGTTTHGYSASVTDAVVTLTAAVGTGATPNGHVVATVTTGAFSVATSNIAGGVTAVTAVAQVSTIAVTSPALADQFTITVDGVTVAVLTGLAAGMGLVALVHKKRVWSLSGSLLRYCALNNPADWSTTSPAATGAGSINISSDSGGAQDLVALGVYQGLLAIFAREAVVIYSISTDAEENAIVETVENTGTFAPGSVIPFGNTDLFYLADSGVRSLRARDGTSAAFKSDIGEALDPFIQDIVAEVAESAAVRAQAIIDPLDSRYLLKIGQYLVALSYYPDSKIRAWSYIDFGTSIAAIVRSGRTFYVRAGNTIYAYGGAAGTEYPDDDEFPTVALTPFMDAKDPAARKMLEGWDMACSGEWQVDVLVDPNNFDAYLRAGRISRNTFNQPPIKLPGEVSHVAFRFTCTKAGDATLSGVAIHYEKGKAG